MITLITKSRYVSLILYFILAAGILEAQIISFGLKSAPDNLTVTFNGEILRPVSASSGIRNFNISGNGILHFSSSGYKNIEYRVEALPLKNGLLEIKLELENGIFERIGEYPTGVQPKSAFFTPDGRRIIVPLLGQRGVDVFRLLELDNFTYLFFEKRLAVPGSNAAGFVEAKIDERRREIWVSNMEENMVHIFDLDSLDYKISLETGGIFPKVITQNQTGTLTVVSNWISCDISIFDSETKTLLHRIPVGGTPRGMAFSSDGRFLYIAIYDEPVITVIDMIQNRVISSFRLYEGQGAARHIIYHEGKLYVSDMFRGTVNVLNASTGTLLLSRRIGPNINTIVLSTDGDYLFASSRGRNNPEDYTKAGPDFGAIYMLRTSDLSLVERVWGRNQPTGLALSPNGKYLVFTNFLDANLELYRRR